MYNPFNLKGKTLLITGASSGIGRATAIECSKLEARVILLGRNEERLTETYKNLDHQELEHQKYIVDFCNEESVINFAEYITDLNGIVHSAGIPGILPFHFVTKKKLLDIFDVNFFSPVLLTKVMLKNKKMRENSSIVFVSSIDGVKTGHIGNSMYSATKGALSGITKSMAVELASKKIRINSVLPGQIETPLIHAAGFSQEQLEKDKKMYPVGRYGDPFEVAWAIIYFLSDASRFTTGAELIIDGGFTLI